MEARKLEQRGRRRLMARNVSEVGSALSRAPRAPPAPRRASTRLHALPLPTAPLPAPRAPAQAARAAIARSYVAPLTKLHIMSIIPETKCLAIATVDTVRQCRSSWLRELVQGPRRCVAVKLVARMGSAGGTRCEAPCGRTRTCRADALAGFIFLIQRKTQYPSAPIASRPVP